MYDVVLLFRFVKCNTSINLWHKIYRRGHKSYICHTWSQIIFAKYLNHVPPHQKSQELELIETNKEVYAISIFEISTILIWGTTFSSINYSLWFESWFLSSNVVVIPNMFSSRYNSGTMPTKWADNLIPSHIEKMCTMSL